MICLVTSVNEIQDSMQSYQKCVDFLKELETFNNRIMPELKEEEQTRKELAKEFSKDETSDQSSLIGDTNNNNHKYILKGGIKFINFSAEYGKSSRALNELNFSI